MSSIDSIISRLGIVVPEPPEPIANYVPYVLIDNLLTVSGQIPMADGMLLHAGRLGAEVNVQEGQEAARQALVNLISQVKHACGGDLSRVAKVVRLGGFVAATDDFSQHAQVMNGASDLVVEIFGEIGRHARSTVGVTSLPANACVEIEGTFRIK